MDGSCFLRLELNASLGFLSVPGHPAGWQEVFPSLVGGLAGNMGGGRGVLLGYLVASIRIPKYLAWNHVEVFFEQVTRQRMTEP